LLPWNVPGTLRFGTAGETNMISDMSLRKMKQQVLKLLKEIIIDPEVNVEVVDIDTHGIESITTGTGATVVWVKVLTNNRPIVMGQFGGLTPNGLYGLFKSYAEGYLMGRYEELFGNKIRFYIDVFEDKPRHYKIEDFSKVVHRKEAIRNGIIKPDSPIDRVMSEYSLEYVLIIGGDVSAPVPGVLHAAANIARLSIPDNVLDLFCGTGAVSKAILLTHKCHVTCVDFFTTNWARQTLAKFNDVNIQEHDVFAYEVDDFYDLIFADPFDAEAMKFVNRFVPKILGKCNLFAMSHGYELNKYWNFLVHQELKKNFAYVKTYLVEGVGISLCSQRIVTTWEFNYE